MDIPELKTEIEYFEAHRRELFDRAPRKFALIKGDECIGTFDTDLNAYEEGVRLYPDEAFLIQEILMEDTIEEMPAYYLGLINAPL